MTWVFSKRCKTALQKKKIKVNIPLNIRNRIYSLMDDFDQETGHTDMTGWNYRSTLLADLFNSLKKEHGIEKFQAYNDKNVLEETDSIELIVKKGNRPHFILDLVEIFFDNLWGDENKYQFQSKFNSIMEESKLTWRMAEGKVFPVDSIYIEEEILRKTEFLLKNNNFHGALEEFEKARTNLINEDTKGAIEYSNKAFESTLKCILNVDKAKPGELIRKIVDSGIIPDYYDGFLKDFEKNILRSVAIMRNEELGAGHGQGESINEIPLALADLGVNLSGVLIKYLIDRNNSIIKPQKSADNTPVEELVIDEDEIPF